MPSLLANRLYSERSTPNLGQMRKEDSESGEQNNMKICGFITLMLAAALFLGAVATIEAPRKPKKRDGTCYVLPRVEDMPTVANPLQF